MLAARPCTAADLPAVVRLFELLDVAEMGEAQVDEDEVAGLLDRDGETLLVTAPEGPVGFAHVQPNGECDTVVDPAHARSLEVREQLLDWVLARGSALGVEVLEHWAGPGRRLNAAALGPRGFRHTRTTWELTRALGADLPVPAWPDGVELVEGDRSLDEPVWDLVMRAFAGSPFSHARPFEQWRRLVLDGGFTALVARRGDRLVGCAIRGRRGANGQVGQLAVDPAEQGQGLGRALLLECFARDAAAGLPATNLGVDGENDTARALYEGVGMRVVHEYWRWDLALQPASAT